MSTDPAVSETGELRADLDIISRWIEPGARVLDLGCGDGTLLARLMATQGVTGYGLEINPDNVIASVAAGVNVLQLDLDDGLSQFEDDSFDVVLMTAALQEVRRPDLLLAEMLRIGRESVVTFPNFGHWKPRLSIALRGVMPISRAMPDEWYDTPNIHLCTVRDFERLCRMLGINITRRHMVNHAHRSTWGMRLLPNLLGEIALYRLRR
ncbi:methionine biosynthesis protein MetW [Spectribacter acetivorans]|uniref:methionine biosynthesis protein MetW n=1 Tax=Spectribacter acetivorans TaxID=3075603 RepID=UPI0032C2413F